MDHPPRRHRVQIGIESGNDETLRLYRKPLTRDSLERGIETLLDAGVEAVYGNFIVGGPGESAEMVRQNIEFARELIRRYPGRIELSASILAHNAGADLFERPEAYGLHFTPESVHGAMAYLSAACSTDLLDRREIDALYEEFNRAMAEEVKANLERLGPEQTRHQLRYNEIGFSTPWSKALLGVPHVSKHYQYVRYEGSHLDLADVPEGGLPDAIPQRTKLEVQLSVDGRVVLSGLSGKVRELNATASFLDEVACGQLTIRQIAARLHEGLPPATRPPFDRILSDTVAFYRRLAEEMYVAFVIPHGEPQVEARRVGYSAGLIRPPIPLSTGGPPLRSVTRTVTPSPDRPGSRAGRERGKRPPRSGASPPRSPGRRSRPRAPPRRAWIPAPERAPPPGGSRRAAPSPSARRPARGSSP